MLDRSTELPVGDSRKLDPTGTSGIRAAFRAAGKLRLRQLRAALRNAVVGNDLLGLSQDSIMRYHATSTRLAALSNSLEADADRLLCCDWFVPHVQRAWHAGFDTAAREMNAEMMWSPSVSDKLNEMANREIRGIVAAIVQQVTRAAARLLTRRGHKVKAWRALLPPFDKVGELRIALLADTMTVMAYNEAKLEVYGAAGVKQVGVNPEWLPPRRVRDAFDPSEQRDPHGRWGSGSGGEDVVVYHGTFESVLSSIRSKGLTVRGNKRNFDSDEYVGARGQSVYVTKDADEARGWPLLGSNVPRGARVAVLEVHVPKGEAFKLQDDEFRGGDGTSYRYAANIPPEWIRGYSTQDPRTRGWTEFKPFHDSETADVFYVSIAIGKKQWIRRTRDALKVGVRTAGDDKVCFKCQDYAAGAPYELEDVEMTLPLHPRCRCSWYPWRDKRFKHDTLEQRAGIKIL